MDLYKNYIKFNRKKSDRFLVKSEQNQGYGTPTILSQEDGWQFDIAKNLLTALYNIDKKYRRNRLDSLANK